MIYQVSDTGSSPGGPYIATDKSMQVNPSIGYPSVPVRNMKLSASPYATNREVVRWFVPFYVPQGGDGIIRGVALPFLQNVNYTGMTSTPTASARLTRAYTDHAPVKMRFALMDAHGSRYDGTNTGLPNTVLAQTATAGKAINGNAATDPFPICQGTALATYMGNLGFEFTFPVRIKGGTLYWIQCLSEIAYETEADATVTEYVPELVTYTGSWHYDVHKLQYDTGVQGGASAKGPFYWRNLAGDDVNNATDSVKGTIGNLGWMTYANMFNNYTASNFASTGSGNFRTSAGGALTGGIYSYTYSSTTWQEFCYATPLLWRYGL